MQSVCGQWQRWSLKINTQSRNRDTRTSLVLRWLRIHLPIQGYRFHSYSGKTPHATGQLGLCTATPDPELESPHTTAPEARGPRACALQQERYCGEQSTRCTWGKPCTAVETQHSQKLISSDTECCSEKESNRDRREEQTCGRQEGRREWGDWGDWG